MEKLRTLFFRMFDRRKMDKPVSDDRRQRKPRLKEIDARLKSAVDRLEEKTARMIRGDLSRCVANDRQQVVIFSTFREICQFKGPEIAALRLCRHKDHPEAANSAYAICDEDKCPSLTAALKGAA